jgi:hypothetical protein
MIFGLVAIPVLSVTSAALVADVASTTDPAAAAVGIPATLGGVVMGALVFRLARVACSGAVTLRALLLARPAAGRRLVAEVSHAVAPIAVLRPAPVLVPTRVGRRGPPQLSR